MQASKIVIIYTYNIIRRAVVSTSCTMAVLALLSIARIRDAAIHTDAAAGLLVASLTCSSTLRISARRLDNISFVSWNN